jgi:PAS domain S-box-containing protein
MTDKSINAQLHQKIQTLEADIEIYRSLVDRSQELMYRTDLEGRIVFVSPSVFKLSGYTAEEAIGMKMAEEIYLFAEERNNFLSKLQQDGHATNFEARLKRKDGSIWWALTSAHFYRDQDGNTLGIEGITRDITDLKMTEIGLRASEEKFRTAFHTSPDSINLNRVSDGMYIEINQGFTNLTGYTREDAIGKTSIEINIWENPEDRERLVKGLMETGVVKNLTARFIRKNKEIGMGLMSARILNINNEKIILSITRDITRLEKSKEDLQQSRDQLRLIADNMVDVISQTDANGNLIYASPSLERVFGYSPKNILGKSTLDWVHPDDRDRVFIQAIEAEKKRCSSVLLEYQWQHARGHYLWVESATRPLYDERGNLMGAIFATRDITDKKAYEKQLTRFATVIEQANEEVLITDIDGIIQYINPSLEKNTGYGEKELIGKKPSILKSGIHDSRFYENLWTTILAKKIWKGIIHNQRKNGDIIIHDVRITPILDSRQNLSAFVSIRRDITDQMKIEQQLRQSQKMEAIGTLAGGIAHDFNNILSGILGYADLATNNLGNPARAKKHIEQIIFGGRRAADLIDQILTFSRRGEHKKSSIKLNLVVKEAIRFLRSSIPSNIEIIEKISTQSTAIADPTQIHQIIMNLCTNASQSMQQTGGKLSIRLEEMEISQSSNIPDIGAKAGRYIRLEISDTGSGMDAETLSRMFEPYFTTKKTGEGTGLGLSVVLGIVQEHKGYLKAYSEIEKGTTFHVYFPISTHHTDLHQQDIQTEELKRGTERIMVVDDDSSVRSSTQQILQDFGYKTSAFSDGKQAFEAFKKQPDQFDLIITDRTMPRMTGDELSKKIYKIRSKMPMIICSGYGQDPFADETAKENTPKYLQKPVDSKALLFWIRTLLDKN